MRSGMDENGDYERGDQVKWFYFKIKSLTKEIPSFFPAMLPDN